MPVSKLVIVRVNVPGTHRWTSAPAQVQYLSAQHRHEFQFKVAVSVEDSDREVEFHLFQAEVLSTIKKVWPTHGPGLFDFGERSCEMIAETLADVLISVNFGVRFVEVWEDGECGARVEY